MQRKLLNEFNSIVPKKIAEPFLYALFCGELSDPWFTGRMGGPHFNGITTTKDTFCVSNGRRDSFSRTINLITPTNNNYFVVNYGKMDTIVDCCTDLKCLMTIFKAISTLTDVWGVTDLK